jgi:cytoskeleton protein RodZ
MSAASDDTSHVVASTPGIGYRLQQARERKKLSVADAASQLRFTRTALIHLEQEEWDQLHGRIYARGYLLSYVKFLGLPVDDMLSAFNVQYGETERERPSSLLMSKSLPDEKPFPWLSSVLIIIVFAIAAVAYQYWSQQDVEPAQQSSINSNTPLSAPQADLLDDIGIQANPGNARDTRDVSKLDELRGTVLMVEPMPADMASQSQKKTTEAVNINAVEAQAGSSESMEQQDVAAETNGEANLTVVATASSWIEVKDNGGNTLLSRVLEQETVNLTGSIPLSVRVGNVAGTTLRFNDNPVDLEIYQRNNVARLTLGAQS